MFTPKYPPPDTATAPPTVPQTLSDTAPVDLAQVSTPLPQTRAASRTTVQLTPGTVVGVAAGGTAVVLVVGAVLVSMLLAVAITAASVALCAVVLRTLFAQSGKER
ncbi:MULTISPECIES: hypothetical protein [Streptomyces]|uniref:SpdD protein n=1 Tax=Streptomyces fradiae ATCC 10745 = DSM 40063 TaxID=1319510 RepID=A0A1Y2NQN9_STRFR|nr:MULTISPECIES: hypothetical protein [Streptomyces]KAF0650963.1 hypothetical protein K701_06175 [Streptomyces fradiae ATCC 10745 = DSM 40063]OSY49813.1 hypothetical protein BG846_04556 [Streptomyces fradiae ATCC 10745 = DSM 40063]QEV13224.1 SpdD protein [Streptomyces fradiae ATCC 10745 = DSM 40063]